MGISSRVSTDQFPETMPAPLLLFVVLGLLALFSFVGDFAQLALDELRLGRHPVRHGDEERLHLLPVAVDLLLLALGEMDPPVKGEVVSRAQNRSSVQLKPFLEKACRVCSVCSINRNRTCKMSYADDADISSVKRP